MGDSSSGGGVRERSLKGRMEGCVKAVKSCFTLKKQRRNVFVFYRERSLTRSVVRSRPEGGAGGERPLSMLMTPRPADTLLTTS